GTSLLRTQVERALGELVALGLASSDSFAGLRALLVPTNERRPLREGVRPRRRHASVGIEAAGRWTRVARGPSLDDAALQLVRRWGVVCRRIGDLENDLPPWRDLLRVFRRLEARGDIRGGRFVAGFSGEQFALPEAVGRLRDVRREAPSDTLVAVSGADPLN